MKTFLVVCACILGAWLLNRLIWPEVASRTLESVSGKVRYVVDGDSLYIGSYEPQIRLWGVDAPEKAQAGFEAASKTLYRYAYGQHVRCEKIDTDRYGRTVARCWLKDGRELNRLMIESGTAKEYRRYSKGFYSR